MKKCFLSIVCLWVWLAGCKKELPTPDSGFAQKSPASGAMDVAWLPVFEWNASEGAASYALVVSNNSSYASPVIDVPELKETMYTATVALTGNTKYYWKVTATGANGATLATNAGIAFTTASAPVRSSRYYVAPDGVDSPENGTAAKPFKTLAFAASQVPADKGDTILLAAGTYTETRAAMIPTGVHVMGTGQDKTILSSSGIIGTSPNKNWYEGSLILLVSPHNDVPHDPKTLVLPPKDGNQTLSGFTIDGNNKSLKAGVWVENRNNVTMHHVSIKNCDQRGAVFAAGEKDWFAYPKFWMQNTKVYNCTFTNCGKDLTDETLGNLCLAQLDGADIHDITINDNQGYGIKFIFDGYFKNTKIHDCNITVSESDSKWGEDIAVELWNIGPGNEVHDIVCNTWLSIVNHPEMFGTPAGLEQMKVYNIRMIDKDGNSNKEAVEIGAPGVEVYNSYFENKGIGIAIWDMGRQNISVHNNVFYNATEKSNWASGAAIYIDNSRTWDFGNIRIDNNVFDTHRVAVKLKGNRIRDIKVRNNVFLNTGLADMEAVGDNIAFDNNLKFATPDKPWAVTGATSQNRDIQGNPGFRATGNRWDTYYKPVSGSSLVVDKGADVGLPFKGAAPDIGCFEF